MDHFLHLVLTVSTASPCENVYLSFSCNGGKQIALMFKSRSFL